MKDFKIGIGASSGSRYDENGYKKLREFGFTHLDFNMSNTETKYYIGTNKECDEVILAEKAKADEAGIKIHQVHGPFRWPACDTTVEERAERMEKMKHSLRLTALMGVKYWVVHPIMPFGFDERISNPGHEQETWDINKEFMSELLKVAKQYGIKICLENMPAPDFSIGSVKEILRFVEEMDDDNFRICLDTGHASLYPDQSVGDAVRLLGDKICVVHVHDNNGHNDNHWLPYQGVINWEDFGLALKEINYQGVFNYETCPPQTMPDTVYEDACKLMVKVAKTILDV